MKILKIVFVLLLIAFIIAQFVPVDKSNPNFDNKLDLINMENPPEEIANMLRSTCYDCHSNETVWPWYSNIAPVSWVVAKHVVEGRDNFNFSFWGEYDQDDKAYAVEEIIEEMEDGGMPIPGYDLTHPEAKLTIEQKESLYVWLRTLQK